MDTPKQISPTFEVLGRIDKKIESLRSVLAPVIQQCPEKAQGSDSVAGTELLGQLCSIEANITNLLDSVEI